MKCGEGKGVPGNGNHSCKGPVVGESIIYMRTQWRLGWQEWREQRCGQDLGDPQGLWTYLKSKDDTQGRTGGGQEGIQFHSIGCGTRRHTRKKALKLLVLEKYSPWSTAWLSHGCPPTAVSSWAGWSPRPEWIIGRMLRGGRGTRSSSPDLLSPLRTTSHLGRKPVLAARRSKCVVL